jgi:tetratricopeptide (TPR) repeat protein
MTKRKASWYLLCLLCLFLWPDATQGQSPKLMEANNRAAELYAQGRYKEAIPFARNVVKLSEEEFGPDHPTTATLLNNLAGLYLAQAMYAEAEPLYLRSLAIREKTLGPYHFHIAESVNNLAMLYGAQGIYAEAEPLRSRKRPWVRNIPK